MTTEPLLLVADLLYALGWSVWTGVVVVFFVQIWPEPKRRQLKRWLDAYEATLRNKARAGSGQASGDDQGRCCSCCDRVGSRQTAAMRTRRPRSAAVARSAFAGFCFPPDVIVLAVRWYLRFALSYRDVEELVAERGVEVDHVTIYRWVQRFTPLLAEAARPCRHAVGDRWQVDETYVKVAGRWRYVCRAIDQFGQVIDVFVSPRRDAAAARGSWSGRSARRRSSRWRSSPIRQPPTQSCWRSCCPRPGIAPTATPITESNAIMVG